MALHHLKPKHRGGTDADGLVEVTRNQHIMFHFCEYQRLGLLADKLAYKMMSGKTEEGEQVRIEMVKKALTGKPKTDEHKKNMSKSCRAAKRKPSSLTTKDRIANTAKQQVTFIATNPEGFSQEVTGLQQFCRQNNLPKSSVHRCVHGKARQCN